MISCGLCFSGFTVTLTLVRSSRGLPRVSLLQKTSTLLASATCGQLCWPGPVIPQLIVLRGRDAGNMGDSLLSLVHPHILTSSANGNHYQSVNPIVYIWIQEMKRHYSTWLYVSFIVHRDIFALRVHLFMLTRMRLSFCARARPYFGYLLVSPLDFLHANSRTVWLKGNWPQGINWNHVKTHKASEDHDDDCNIPVADLIRGL